MYSGTSVLKFIHSGRLFEKWFVWKPNHTQYLCILCFVTWETLDSSLYQYHHERLVRLRSWVFSVNNLVDDWIVWHGRCSRTEVRQYSIPRAAATRFHQLGGLKQQKFILSQLWRLEVRHQVVCSLSEAPRAGFFLAPYGFWWWPVILGVPWLVAAWLCTLLPFPHSPVRWSARFPSPYKGTSHWI